MSRLVCHMIIDLSMWWGNNIIIMACLSCCRILGANNKNLNHIVEVFVKVLSHGTELAEPETADHMVRLLSQMQASLPPQVRSITLSALR